MLAYATTDDLAAYWRELTEAERAKAGTLLGFASTIVSAHSANPNADAARFVVCDMVKTAMQPGADTAPVTQMTMTGGPYSRTVQYANPSGDLYWKAQYDQVLGLTGTSVGCIRARTALDG